MFSQDTVYASIDSYIDEFSDAGLESNPTIIVRKWAASLRRRGLIRFPSSSLPDSGSTITSATIELYVVSAVGVASTLAANKIQQSPTRDWDANVKWSKYDGSDNWSSTGGDFTAPATATYAINNVADAGTYLSLDVTSDVQNFVNDTAKNFGWMLKHNDESGGSEATWNFGSLQEVISGEARPRLVINHTAPLPVTLLSFDYKYQGSSVLLKWTTATEISNDFYTIERSADGLLFEERGMVGGAGNSSSLKEYSFNDTGHEGPSYYRLKQTDYDGKYEYFKVIYVPKVATETSDYSIFYNNRSQQYEITLHTRCKKPRLSVYTLQGELVQTMRPVDENSFIVSKENGNPQLFMLFCQQGVIASGKL